MIITTINEKRKPFVGGRKKHGVYFKLLKDNNPCFYIHNEETKAVKYISFDENDFKEHCISSEWGGKSTVDIARDIKDYEGDCLLADMCKAGDKDAIECFLCSFFDEYYREDYEDKEIFCA